MSTIISGSWRDKLLMSEDTGSSLSRSSILNEKLKTAYSSEFIWRVENFCERLSYPVIAQSPTFDLGPSSWRLDMIHAHCTKSKISVVVNRLNRTENTTLKFSLSVKDVPQYFDDEDPHIRASVVFDQDTSSQVMERLLALDQIEQKAQDIDLLDLHCAVTVSCSTSLSHEPLLLSQDLQNLCDPSTSTFYDVILVVNGKEFPAHKSILSARSSVMKAMFASTMSETIQNRVTIHDIDTDVFKEMLSYIYTGQNNYNVIMSKPQEILSIANQYDLPGLKTKCEEILAESITTESAIALLKVADMYCAEVLKWQLFTFIMDNFIAVFCTNDFLDLCKTDSLLLDQLHKSISSLHQSNGVVSAQRKERKTRFSPYGRNHVNATVRPIPTAFVAKQCP